MSVQSARTAHDPIWIRYLGWLAVLAAVIAAGYIGFRAFVAAGDLSALNLFAVALIAGVASGLSITSAEPSQFVRIFRVTVGLLVLVLGIGQLANWNLKPRFAEALTAWARPRRGGGRSPATTLYLYGLGYNAAGMGCTGPILAGLMVLALASGGFSTALPAFVLFSLTMGGLMLLVSGLVANSNQTLIKWLKSATPRIKEAAGVLLILVGAFNPYFSLNLRLFRQVLFP